MKYEENIITRWILEFVGRFFHSSSFQMMGNQPIRMRISLIITTRTGSSQVFAWFLLGYWCFLHLVVNNTPWKNHRSKFMMILKLASEKKIYQWKVDGISWSIEKWCCYSIPIQDEQKTLKHIDSIPPLPYRPLMPTIQTKLLRPRLFCFHSIGKH